MYDNTSLLSSWMEKFRIEDVEKLKINFYVKNTFFSEIMCFTA
jgi:hypothetical protein